MANKEVGMTDKKEYLSDDAQIDFVHYVEDRLKMAINLMKDIKTEINKNTSKFSFDKEIIADLGLVEDAADYVIESITRTIHDASLDFYKTSDEKFIECANYADHITDRENVTSIHNHNKL